MINHRPSSSAALSDLPKKFIHICRTHYDEWLYSLVSIGISQTFRNNNNSDKVKYIGHGRHT
jgi:hypothetical protein